MPVRATPICCMGEAYCVLKKVDSWGGQKNSNYVETFGRFRASSHCGRIPRQPGSKYDGRPAAQRLGRENEQYDQEFMVHLLRGAVFSGGEALGRVSRSDVQPGARPHQALGAKTPMQTILSGAKNPLLIPPEDLPRIWPKLYRKMTPRQRTDLVAVNRKSS